MKHFIIGFITAIILCILAIYFLVDDKTPADKGRVMNNPIAIEFEHASSNESSSESREGIVIIPTQPMSAIE